MSACGPKRFPFRTRFNSAALRICCRGISLFAKKGAEEFRHDWWDGVRCRRLAPRFSQPTMQPIIGVTCTFLEGLTQPSATCKLLKVGDSHSLKRLASAVQLRPWPPYFLQLTKLASADSVRTSIFAELWARSAFDGTALPPKPTSGQCP